MHKNLYSCMHFGQLYITTEQLRYFVQIFDIKNPSDKY